MVGFATANDFARLTELWQEGFHDDPAYIRRYLETFACDDNIFAFRENDTIVSAAYCMESTIAANCTNYKAWYIYAVTTAAVNRGRGYSNRIIARIKEYAKTQNVKLLFLTPGSESLRTFYQKAGFEDAFYCDHFRINRKDTTKNTRNTISVADLSDLNEVYALRNLYYKDNYVKWNKKHIAYALGETVYPEIAKRIFDNGNLIGYIYGFIRDNCLVLPEICVKETEMEKVFSALFDLYPIEHIVCSCAQTHKGCKKSKGMLYLIDDFIDICQFESVYLSLNLE